MAPFQAVLIDIDGTLVDSNDLHAEAWVAACVEHDRPVQFHQVRPLIGMGGDLLLKELLGLDPDGDMSKRMRATREGLFREQYLLSVRPFPRAREFVERCLQAGLRCVVASSASEKDAAELLRVARVADLIHDATTASDAERTKPCPDIIEAAVAKAGKDPGQVVLVGDTPFDVTAASRAGVPTIAVRSGGWQDEALAGAIAVYDDVADLLQRWDESPLGARRGARGTEGPGSSDPP